MNDIHYEDMYIHQRNDKMKSINEQTLTTITKQSNEFIKEEYKKTIHLDNDKQKLIHDVVLYDLTEQFRLNLLTQFNEQLKISLNDLVTTAISKDNYLHNMQLINDWMTDKHKTDGKSMNSESLPTKHYRTRDSVLTTLFHISHIRTVYNIFVAITIIFSVNTVIQDFIDPKINLYAYNMDILRFAFGNLSDVFRIWFAMKMSTIFIPFWGVLLWITCRPKIGNNICSMDWLFFLAYIIYQVIFFVTSFRFTIICDLPPASTAIVTGEQIRLIMKSHAYIRYAISKIFEDYNESIPSSSTITIDTIKEINNNNNNNNHCNHNQSNVTFITINEFPNFSRYLYFLFAPTLVYRENYPRTHCIRWYFVFSNFLQVIVCFIFSYYIFMRFCFIPFSQLGKLRKFSFKKYILTSTACTLPGGLLMLIAFYSFLHSWLNAFAEMLRFGDRLFYKDWWNATTFSVWYRTWNVIVHDWLYTYIYRDIQSLIGKQSRTIAATVVFWLSAGVHEYILMMSLRYCLPVLFLFFSIGGYVLFFVQGSGRGWNVAIWISLFVGWGQMICLYSMEWYARKHCPPVLDGYLNFFMPHIILCPNTNYTNLV
ncbi:hypothetical protein MN116_001030 [Schistosoma mekongi]|uniref:O-acyltransferase n=1 Tax=Schistosoma mekongi TaxID=38744 RepID=A0AAE1ZKD0_SCHME|nr:hypothetical protein MN116_001030 [Schistosoma mekongi]